MIDPRLENFMATPKEEAADKPTIAQAARAAAYTVHAICGENRPQPNDGGRKQLLFL
jgi:hypothetical protein